MTPWAYAGFGTCHMMALALFFAGLLSWYGWSANVHITDLWLPIGTLNIDIWSLEQRTVILGDNELDTWMVGIPFMAIGVLLWRQCHVWKNRGGPYREPAT